MDFDPYDHGYRLGVFDKCNGRAARHMPGDEPDLFLDGYLDGFATNENQMPTDEEREEAEAEAAANAGVAYAKDQRMRVSAYAATQYQTEHEREAFLDSFFETI